MTRPMPTFEVIEVTVTRFQINEQHPGERVVFVGLRETREEAEATVERMRREYREAGYFDCTTHDHSFSGQCLI